MHVSERSRSNTATHTTTYIHTATHIDPRIERGERIRMHCFCMHAYERAATVKQGANAARVGIMTWCVAVCCSALQCVAVRCSALQCVVVCYSVLFCGEVFESVGMIT